MDTAAELTALKNEITLLREELRELRSFFTIETIEDNSGRKIMHLRCSGITLLHPEKPEITQGMFWAGETGPSLALWGHDERARLTLDVENNEARVRILGDDLKQLVDIGRDGKDNTHVAVFHEGKPRAVLKGLPEVGFVSAVHDDGTVRACIMAHEGHGEVMVVGGDMQPAVKLSGSGQDGGGYLGVNHPSGKPALILTNTHHGGGIVSSNSHGETLDVWPGSRDGEEG